MSSGKGRGYSSHWEGPCRSKGAVLPEVARGPLLLRFAKLSPDEAEDSKAAVVDGLFTWKQTRSSINHTKMAKGCGGLRACFCDTGKTSPVFDASKLCHSPISARTGQLGASRRTARPPCSLPRTGAQFSSRTGQKAGLLRTQDAPKREFRNSDL